MIAAWGQSAYDAFKSERGLRRVVESLGYVIRDDVYVVRAMEREIESDESSPS